MKVPRWYVFSIHGVIEGVLPDKESAIKFAEKLFKVKRSPRFMIISREDFINENYENALFYNEFGLLTYEEIQRLKDNPTP